MQHLEHHMMDRIVTVEDSGFPPFLSTTLVACNEGPFNNVISAPSTTTNPRENREEYLDFSVEDALNEHDHEGIFDTLRLQLLAKISYLDLQRLLKSGEWEVVKSQKNSLFTPTRYIHKKSGAVLSISKKFTLVQFSPIRVLGNPSNLHINDVSKRDLLKVIRAMTTKLLPRTSAASKDPWTLTCCALTRNLILGEHRDYVFPVLCHAAWRTRTVTVFDPQGLFLGNAPLRPAKRTRNGLPIPSSLSKYPCHFDEARGIECYHTGSLGRRCQIAFQSWGRGNKSRLVLYAKMVERLARRLKIDVEAAARMFRLECTYHGSNQVIKLAKYLPPGNDIFIRHEGRIQGFSIDYRALHACFLGEVMLLRAPGIRKKPNISAYYRRNIPIAVGMLLHACYPYGDA